MSSNGHTCRRGRGRTPPKPSGVGPNPYQYTLPSCPRPPVLPARVVPVIPFATRRFSTGVREEVESTGVYRRDPRLSDRRLSVTTRVESLEGPG